VAEVTLEQFSLKFCNLRSRLGGYLPSESRLGGYLPSAAMAADISYHVALVIVPANLESTRVCRSTMYEAQDPTKQSKGYPVARTPSKRLRCLTD
jgi:hypothetical protein